jgi:hypothetical protein
VHKAIITNCAVILKKVELFVWTAQLKLGRKFGTQTNFLLCKMASWFGFLRRSNTPVKAAKLGQMFPIATTKPTTKAPLSWDAPQTASTYINFLSLVNPVSYTDISYLNQAVNRYNKYFQLAHSVYSKDGLEALSDLVPTRDISLMWATHMIHPHKYRAWRKIFFDGSEGKKLAVNTWYSNQSMRIQQHSETAPVELWKQRYAYTENLWKAHFDEDYLVQSHGKLPKQKSILTKSELEEFLGINLHDAVQRHLRFAGRVLALKPVINQKYLERATHRYLAFLKLAPTVDGPIVPTLDIDIIWHSHMLSPIDYFPECKTLAGRVLDHNDEMPNDQLSTAFNRTKSTWEKQYHTPMVGKRKQHQSSGCGGCASCGFGDHYYHSSLPHNITEQQALESAFSNSLSNVHAEPDFLYEAPPLNSYLESEFFADSPNTSDSSNSWSFFDGDGGGCSSCGGD